MISKIILLSISLVLGYGAYFLIRKHTEILNTLNKTSRLLSAACCVMAIYWVLYLILPTVIIIDRDSNGKLIHSTNVAFISYDGHPVSLGDNYILNKSDKNIHLVPCVYGEQKEHPFKKEVFEPNSFKKAKRKPDYYFSSPNSLRVNENTKTKVVWVLR